MKLSMINQFEVPMYLEEVLPDISTELKKTTDPANAYQSVHVFIDYTFNKIREHNIPATKKCFALADILYSKGNSMVKCAVENVYVFSFSHLPISDNIEKKLVMGLIPCTLYTLYMKQVMHLGA